VSKLASAFDQLNQQIQLAASSPAPADSPISLLPPGSTCLPGCFPVGAPAVNPTDQQLQPPAGATTSCLCVASAVKSVKDTAQAAAGALLPSVIGLFLDYAAATVLFGGAAGAAAVARRELRGRRRREAEGEGWKSGEGEGGDDGFDGGRRGGGGGVGGVDLRRIPHVDAQVILPGSVALYNPRPPHARRGVDAAAAATAPASADAAPYGGATDGADRRTATANGGGGAGAGAGAAAARQLPFQPWVDAMRGPGNVAPPAQPHNVDQQQQQRRLRDGGWV
jgi:hypothetical protein